MMVLLGGGGLLTVVGGALSLLPPPKIYSSVAMICNCVSYHCVYTMSRVIIVV